MSASEEFILAIQTGDLAYIEKHLKRPVSIAIVVQAVWLHHAATKGAYAHRPSSCMLLR